MSFGKLAPSNRANSGEAPATPVAMNYFANPGQNADPMPVPATSYATTRTPMSAPYRPEQGVQNRTRSASVSRKPRMNGLDFDYVHGDTNMGGNVRVAMKATGQVESTVYQPVMRNLWDWCLNRKWYICYPAATVMNGGKHNLALSIRVDQLKTTKTGGPGKARMAGKPAFVKVQDIRRYSSIPATYQTKSSPA